MKVEKTQQTTVVLLLAVFMIFFAVCVTSCTGRSGAIVVDKATTSSFGVGTVQKIVFADGYDDDNIVVTIPAKALEPIGTVVVLEIKCQ